MPCCCVRARFLPPCVSWQEQSVGASLGNDSIKSGIYASLIGFGLIVIGMLIYYKQSGCERHHVPAGKPAHPDGIHGSGRATLTLPGIAGIILTIGMAVDANILIFERIREELRAGKTVRAAVDIGFQQGVLDHFRFECHHSDRCGFSVSVRHRADPRICRDPYGRTAGQHVYGHLCVAPSF